MHPVTPRWRWVAVVAVLACAAAACSAAAPGGFMTGPATGASTATSQGPTTPSPEPGDTVGVPDDEPSETVPSSATAPAQSAPTNDPESPATGRGTEPPRTDDPKLNVTTPPSGTGPDTTAPPSSAPAKTTAGGTSASPAPDPIAVTVLTALDQLRVKGRAPMTNYDRAQFGPAWSDATTVEASRNGCDTRNDILRRDLVDIATSTASNGCLVLKGVLHDRYTGATIAFTRGEVTSMAVQIDHIVALADAWQKGAQHLTADQRENFANDPLNLQAVDGPTNSAKSAGDASTWLPPKKAYRCTYVARQVLVKQRYDLWVTRAEHDAMARVLSRCSKRITLPKRVPALDGGTAEPPTNCYPLSNKGNCYEIGQQCATRYRGDRGLDARGREMRCVERNGYWRWEL